MHIYFNYQEHNSYLKTSLEWDLSILPTSFLFRRTEHLPAFRYLFACDF